MTNTEVWNDLAQRLQRLHSAAAAMSGARAPHGQATGSEAMRWADALEGTATMDDPAASFADPGEAADALLTHLIPEHEQNGSAFWRTELGRAIARAGRAPERQGPAASWHTAGDASARVPGAVLAAILGVSRNRAFELQKAGRLLTADQVATELRAREAS
jgi:hypothetical protein